MSWFNINYLNDPSFIKSVNSGGGYKAIGDALATLGGIYNAERDRKYKQEQDEREHTRKDTELAAQVEKWDTERQKNLAAAYANEELGRYRGIQSSELPRLNNAKIANYSNQMSNRNANTAINRYRADVDAEYKQTRLGQHEKELGLKYSGGGGSKNGNGWKQKYPLNADLNKALKIDSLLDTDLD